MKFIATLISLVFCVIIQAQTFDWTALTTNTNSSLTDVFFHNDDEGWVVGHDGIILHTTNGGSSWSPQSSGNSEKLYSIFFIDANNGWISGGSVHPTLLHTSDGGAHWVDVTPSGLTSIIIYDVAFQDANIGWFITNSKIYMTSDGGNTWAEENYGPDVDGPYHRALAVTEDTIAHVASKSGSGHAYMAEVYHRKTYPQDMWVESVVSDFGIDDPQLLCIDFPSKDVGYCAGEAGIIYKFTPSVAGEYGGPWDSILNLSPNNTSYIHSISFLDNDNGSFISHTEINGITHALIHTTTDGGNSWEKPDSIPSFFARDIQFVSDDRLYVIGLDGKAFKGVPSTATHVSGVNAMQVQIYPNPTQSFVHITSSSRSRCHFQLISSTGEIKNDGYFYQKTQISTAQLSSGIYIIKTTSAEGISHVTTLIKK